jgi:hypothetical protein
MLGWGWSNAEETSGVEQPQWMRSVGTNDFCHVCDKPNVRNHPQVITIFIGAMFTIPLN